MAKLDVVIFPDPRLRDPNSDVTVFDEELKKLTDDMFETMYENDGIGLAGPQVNVHKNLVVIDIPEEDGSQGNNKLVIVNPRIEKLEGDIVESQEGCLSVPGYSDTVHRYAKCTVSCLDVTGQPQRFEADGQFAICLQHEIDHLSGKIFIDYLSRLKRERLRKKYGKILKERQQEE